MLEATKKIAKIVCPEAFDRRAFLKLLPVETRRRSNTANIVQAMVETQKQAYERALKIIEVVYDELDNIEKEKANGRPERQQAREADANTSA